ncbi:hypothetical protein CAPTEDRAFT_187193 [Capitella teleta]|uniref:Major facilitator superfamily (MFS) profile domain-containing protein n=1 Tax=Capitella teleta TaxID=283909 RepID=R7VHQ8_CAPTE|nr:hypothetical protein CAPTEDRAFT_187193 [Capitella teleta]|eukprot:ELU15210.1 hypothetical protein CAPTEDRAFT_187193 [Capitella teleta]
MGMPQANEGSQLLDLTLREDCHHEKYSWNMIKSVTILISELILGMSMTLLPAVLHDLSLQLQMSYTQLSIANSMAGVAAIFGSVVGGNVILQSLEWFVQGFAVGVGYVVNNILVVHLWPKSVGPIVLLVSAANSVGQTAGSLLPIPFVSNESVNDNSTTVVFVPFVILAGTFLANGVSLLIQHAVGVRCHQCYDSDISANLANKQGQSEPKRSCRFSWLVVPGMVIVYLFVRASDIMPSYLGPSIGIASKLHLSASKSDLVSGGYSISKTISKFVTSFLLKRISVMVCLPICLVMTSVLALLLALSLYSVVFFSVTIVTMGLFTGPADALLFVWVNEYLNIDGYVVMVYMITENIGNLSSVLVGGIVFDNYGSLPSLLVNLINGIIACVTFSVFQCLLTSKKNLGLPSQATLLN